MMKKWNIIILFIFMPVFKGCAYSIEEDVDRSKVDCNMVYELSKDIINKNENRQQSIGEISHIYSKNGDLVELTVINGNFYLNCQKRKINLGILDDGELIILLGE